MYEGAQTNSATWKGEEVKPQTTVYDRLTLEQRFTDNQQWSLGRASRGKWVVRVRRRYPPDNGEWQIVAVARSRLVAVLRAWWRSRPVKDWRATPLTVENRVVVAKRQALGRWVSEMDPTDGPCADCGTENTVWFTDNVLWNLVVRDTFGDPLLCMRCFVLRAEKQGYRPDRWRLVPDMAPSSLFAKNSEATP